MRIESCGTKVSFGFYSTFRYFRHSVCHQQKCALKIRSSPILANCWSTSDRPSPTRTALLSMYYWQKQECGGLGAYIRKSTTSLDQAYLLDEPHDHKKSHLVKHAETMMATPIDSSHWLNTQSHPFNPLPSLPTRA